MPATDLTYLVDLDFEVIKLPPVTDVLIIGKKTPHGKFGVLNSFELITPDVFELIEIGDEISSNVEAVIVNKNILNKLPRELIVRILSENVFPFVCRGETINVDINIRLSRKDIKGELDESTLSPII